VPPQRVLSASRYRKASAARHSRKRAVALRKQIRVAQVVGLSAALAAAASASTVAVGIGQGQAPSQAALAQPQLEALTTARIDRSQQATRDGYRDDLSQAVTRKLQASAEEQAQVRAAKLAAQRNLMQRRAAALAAAKAAAAKATAAKVAAAKAAAAAAQARQQAAAKAAAQADAVLPTTGYRITATFGQGGSRWARDHTGTDFAAPTGTPVRSVMAGEVIAAEYAGAYGRQVKVRHTNGTVTSYSHMSMFAVSAGDKVAAGDKVGEIGMTGNTTGPHLHFEVLPDGENQIDPMPWLRKHGLNP